MAKHAAKGSRRLSRGTPTFTEVMRVAGVTPDELAERSGVSVRTVYRARAGRVPYGGNLRALAVELDLSTEECRAAIERGANAVS